MACSNSGRRFREENSVVIKTPKKINIFRCSDDSSEFFLHRQALTGKPSLYGRIRFALQIATKKPEVSFGLSFGADQNNVPVASDKMSMHFILPAMLCNQSGGSIS
jgi:hypothetical protein